uniref:Fungal lipase-type domain-containing protein n=1 Tax=Arundo donax TaxID=35708 RepID=A0A0A9DAV4_ARUDO
MPEAMVHRGFYSAYHNTTLRDGVVSGIQKTRKLYGDVPIMITGHSMGGAMASFCALDLVVSTEPCMMHICFELPFTFCSSETYFR